MLVLTRKTEQTIKIGDDVEIVVVEVRGDQVRLGIRASRDISILRGEIVAEVQAANREAALAEAGDLEALADLTVLPAPEK